MASVLLLIMSGFAVFALSTVDNPEDGLVLFVAMIPYFILCLFYISTKPAGEDWLSLEIEARKAKLRQRIRERNGDAKN